jgi:hypothetical protein
MGNSNSNSSFDWGEAVGAGLAVWMQNQQGKTPNQYPVQLTPEQKRWEDLRYKMATQSTPTRDFISNMGTQFMGQVGGAPPNFSFMSPEMKGQTFAGGVQAPKFDTSKHLGEWWKPTGSGGGSGIPPYNPTNPNTPAPPNQWTRPDGSPLPPNSRIGGGGPHSNGNGVGFNKMPVTSPDQNEVDARFGFGPSIYGGLTEDPHRQFTPDMFAGGREAMDPNDPRNALTPGHGLGDLGERLPQISDWWQTFKQEHPNWASAGQGVVNGALSAAFGLPGAMAAKVLNWLLSREGNGTQRLPGASNTIGNPNQYAPGVKP